MSNTVPQSARGCTHRAHFTDKDEEAWRKDRTCPGTSVGRGRARTEAKSICPQTSGSDKSKAEAMGPGANMPRLKGTPGSSTLIIESMSQLMAHDNTNATEV